jgi:hypothetical protein
MMLKLVFIGLVFSGCGGGGDYKGVLANGMNGEPLSDIRILAKSSPPSPDMTCQVRETKTGPTGAFTVADLCHKQTYILSVPQPNLQLAGGTVVEGSEQTEPGSHQAWWSPDGSGVYLLSGDAVKPLPTFSDVESDEAMDGKKVRYPSMKPTGTVITVDEGKHLVISGKKMVKRLQFYPLVSDSGRRRLKSGWITDHVFIGHKFTNDSKHEVVEATMDTNKVKDVLIRNEGVRYIAHDAFPAGRYALLGNDDDRVTILDFGSSQAPAK